MTFATLLTSIAAELALFSAVGFLLFAINDLAVDLIYFTRRSWRSMTIYRRYPRAFGETIADQHGDERLIAIFVPAWDESAVIASMLRSTVERLRYANYRIFVGHYRNDAATAAAIASVADPRIQPVLVHCDGPTTKADCLNHLYDALIEYEMEGDRPVAAVVLHDSEDVVHPLELAVFNSLIDRAGIIQLPVQPLPTPARAGSPAIIATSLPRPIARNWLCAKPSAPRSRWRGSAARSPGSRSPGLRQGTRAIRSLAQA